eukprot:SAG31_NODE_31677_length_365_cov_0.969925_1_plen_86_part_10
MQSMSEDIEYRVTNSSTAQARLTKAGRWRCRSVSTKSRLSGVGIHRPFEDTSNLAILLIIYDKKHDCTKYQVEDSRSLINKPHNTQ